VIQIDPDGNFTKKTYDDWLDTQIQTGEASVISKTEALKSSKDQLSKDSTRLTEIAKETTDLDKQRKVFADKRKPLETKKTKLTAKEAKELKALKMQNTKLVEKLNKLNTEKGKLESAVIRLKETITRQEAGLVKEKGNLDELKDLKKSFNTAYTNATAKLPKADVELLTDVVMNEARDSSSLAKKAIAYAYTNDAKTHMSGGHVAMPPTSGAGAISHFSAGVTETRFARTTDKAEYIEQVISSLDASSVRLADKANSGDPTGGATNWVSPDAPGMKKTFPPDGLPSWTKTMTKITVKGIPPGEFTFFKK
jgi:hypothetical protein